MVRKVQSLDGVLIDDDMIIAKPHMDENEIANDATVIALR
jgi:hypothetical protein